MPLLPNLEKAELDIEKLSGYCLNPIHPRGRHKARVFARVLDISAVDADWLRSAILRGLATHEAVGQGRDDFGLRWQVDMMLTRQTNHAVIRTIWIAGHETDVPRFVTCWVI